MKHKHFKKHDIIIDLTSMLDVIFIILMVVMCNQHKAGGIVEDKPSLDPIIPPTLEERVSTVTVSIPYDEDIVTRRIEMIINNSPVPRSIEINKDNALLDGAENPYEIFKREIEVLAEDNQAEDIPVILTFDDRDMLYRDAEKVSDILQTLDDQYNNLYCRGLTE